jgi:hypothetical protein
MTSFLASVICFYKTCPEYMQEQKFIKNHNFDKLIQMRGSKHRHNSLYPAIVSAFETSVWMWKECS